MAHERARWSFRLKSKMEDTAKEVNQTMKTVSDNLDKNLTTAGEKIDQGIREMNESLKNNGEAIAKLNERLYKAEDEKNKASADDRKKSAAAQKTQLHDRAERVELVGEPLTIAAATSVATGNEVASIDQPTAMPSDLGDPIVGPTPHCLATQVLATLDHPENGQHSRGPTTGETPHEDEECESEQTEMAAEKEGKASEAEDSSGTLSGADDEHGVGPGAGNSHPGNAGSRRPVSGRTPAPLKGSLCFRVRCLGSTLVTPERGRCFRSYDFAVSVPDARGGMHDARIHSRFSHLRRAVKPIIDAESGRLQSWRHEFPSSHPFSNFTTDDSRAEERAAELQAYLELALNLDLEGRLVGSSELHNALGLEAKECALFRAAAAERQQAYAAELARVRRERERLRRVVVQQLRRGIPYRPAQSCQHTQLSGLRNRGQLNTGQSCCVFFVVPYTHAPASRPFRAYSAAIFNHRYDPGSCLCGPVFF